MLASCDGKPLSSLALKVPPIKKSGDLSTDTTRNSERDAMVRVIDKMAKYPACVLPIHGYMMSTDFESIASVSGSCSEEWTGDYACIKNLPKSWMVSFLQFRSKGLLLTWKMDAKLIEKADPMYIPHLFCFETQTAMSQPLPAECMDKHVCTKVFDTKADQVEPRLKRFIADGGVAASGNVQWKHGCFRLHFTDHKCTRVEHISGTTVDLPAHIVITSDFSLMDNHSDLLARAELAPAKILLHTLFGEDKRAKMGVTKGKVANAALAGIAKLEHELVAQVVNTFKAEIVEGDSTVLKEAKKERQKDAMLKAREKLQAAAKVRGEKRKISLKD